MKKFNLKSMQKGLLEKYFEINGNTAKLSLNYKSINDIVDETFKTANTPVLSDSLFEKLKEYCDILPRNYDVEIQINIEDLGGHSLEEINALFKNNALFGLYKHRAHQRRNIASSISMFILGTIFFALYNIGNYNNWFGVINEFLEIGCWVFYREAVTIIFMEVFGVNNRAKNYFKKIKQFIITNEKVEPTKEKIVEDKGIKEIQSAIKEFINE